MKNLRAKTPIKRTAKTVDEHCFFGLNAVLALARHREKAITRLYFLEEHLALFRKTLQQLAKTKRLYRAVPEAELRKLAGTPHHGGAVAFAAAKPVYDGIPCHLEKQKSPSFFLILLDLQNPHNIGAIYRTAAHFGATGIVFIGDPPSLSGSLARVSEGAVECLQTFRFSSLESAVKELTTMGIKVFGTSPHDVSKSRQTKSNSTALRELPKQVAIILGNEESGIPSSILNTLTSTVTVPGTNAVESLNVSATAAAILAVWREKFPLK